jgi:hypothetical protein
VGRIEPVQDVREHGGCDRVLNDGSPRPGAIISTDKSLFVFRGSAEERRLRPVAEPITGF